MTLQALLILILVGAIAGWLAALVMKGRGLGTLGNIVIGILGAFVGTWLLAQLGLRLGGGLLADILRAFIGAVVRLGLIGLLRGRR